jgi:hypothetical protein
MKIILLALAFIILSTLNFEYLINRGESNLLLIAAIIIEILAFYFIIYLPLIKHKT